MPNDEKPLRPAVVTVGDEILLGEMHDANQHWMLETLMREGMPARLAASLPDDPAAIGHALRAFRAAGHEPIFVSGGIGGTHDDRTREGIADALCLELARHDRCFEILAAKYGDRFNEQRQRMAWLPAGSELIDNPIGAPGFVVAGIYAFPGFPSMLQPMLLQVLGDLSQLGRVGALVTEQAVLPCAEGEIAAEVEAFAKSMPAAKLGIYPSSQQFGREVTLRLRCPATNREAIEQFAALVQRLSDRVGRSSSG